MNPPFEGVAGAPAGDDPNTVSLSDEEGVKEILQQTVLGLWGIVNTLTRLRPTRHERYRVTIFGSARVEEGSEAYEQAKRVAAELTGMGCDILTGGGPGFMQAANEGAASVEGDGRSVGIRVELPFEQEVNPFVTAAYEHQTFFTRLHHFVLASDAFIVAPGGIGTALETFMVWQLLQVHHLRELPLILVGPMWPDLVEWVRKHMVEAETPLVSPEDLDIPECVADADGAIAALKVHHAAWVAAGGGKSES